MLFKDIITDSRIHQHLTSSADKGRIAHAQLFVGPEGSGKLMTALTYAQYVLCGNKNGENYPVESACNLKCQAITHPDMHFAFPVSNSDKVKSHAISDNYISEWRNFLKEQPYGNLFDWYQSIGIEKKQGQIGVDEAHNIVKKLTLKPYEGGYKVMIIWMAEALNTPASNKLLKLIEEPPEKTLFILITENLDQILQTIKSRCQIVQFSKLTQEKIKNSLIQNRLNDKEATIIAHESDGNYNKALDLMNQDSEDLIFEKWFVEWVRTAFRAKGNKAAIHDLISWSEEIAKTGREAQKKFIQFCIGLIRQALLLNYGVKELVYIRIHLEGFDLSKFAPYIHENNVMEIVEELEKALYHIERNGNSKIIMTDLSIKLTRLLHKKPSQIIS
jgi:DNA polymerase-3 subunit delta'